MMNQGCFNKEMLLYNTVVFYFVLVFVFIFCFHLKVLVILFWSYVFVIVFMFFFLLILLCYFSTLLNEMRNAALATSICIVLVNYITPLRHTVLKSA